ncbi:MAG: ROK family protein, partial [Acidobacteriia bacterium]|nr:ROK family protein [Terriglobia bacterium]
MSDIYASVDLGGTNIAGIFAGGDGRVVCERKVPTQSHEGPEAVLNRVAQLVNGLANESGARPVALGMGVPGLADLQRGVTKFLPNLPTQWRDVPVRDVLSPQVG